MTSATIKLFLPQGDAKRLRVGEVSNWTGKALAAPRTELEANGSANGLTAWKDGRGKTLKDLEGD